MTEKEKGYVKGEDHGRATTTWLVVRAMRQEWISDRRVTQRSLAKKYDLAQTTVHRILLNKTWFDPDYNPARR